MKKNRNQTQNWAWIFKDHQNYDIGDIIPILRGNPPTYILILDVFEDYCEVFNLASETMESLSLFVADEG